MNRPLHPFDDPDSIATDPGVRTRSRVSPALVWIGAVNAGAAAFAGSWIAAAAGLYLLT